MLDPGHEWKCIQQAVQTNWPEQLPAPRPQPPHLAPAQEAGQEEVPDQKGERVMGEAEIQKLMQSMGRETFYEHGTDAELHQLPKRPGCFSTCGCSGELFPFSKQSKQGCCQLAGRERSP